MGRYEGFRTPDGLLVLDSETGEVVLIPDDGSAPLVRRAATRAPSVAATSSGVIMAPAPMRRAPGPEISAFDQEILSTYPTPIARAHRRYLEETDPRHRLRLMVDGFTTTLKLWALLVASEYFAAPDAREPALDDMISKDLSRPLISSWNRMLHRGLASLRQLRVDLSAPALESAYDDLERRCRDRVSVRVRYEDSAGRSKYRDSKLGKIQALIKYRNGLAHGFDHDVERARKDLEIYGKVLTDVLEAGRFMARTPLVSAWGSGRGQVMARRWVGADPSAEPVSLEWMDPRLVRDGPVFLLDAEDQRALPLFYFADVSRGGDASDAHTDLLLYDGNTRSTIIYIDSDGRQVETQRRVKEIASRVAAKSGGPRARSATRLGYDALRVAATGRTAGLLDRLRRSGAYARETLVPRAALEAQIAAFELGDYRGLVLAGENGSGKSTLVASHAERWIEEGHVVLFYRAANLSDTSLAPRILRHLGVKGGFFEDFLAEAEPLFTDSSGSPRRLFLIVDALNDHPTDHGGLVRAIDEMVAQAAPHPWCRLVVTERTPAYERLPPDSRLGVQEGARYLTVEEARGSGVVRSPLVHVGPYTDDELLAAYEKYRGYRRRDPDDPEDPGFHPYRPSTPADALDRDGSTFALMRDPLMMRLLMAAHHQLELPPELGNDDAMRLFIDHVVEERDSPRGTYPERRAFLAGLAKTLDSLGADGVTRDALYEVPSMEAALRNAQKDSPYVQLLDLGVLVETWEGAECRVTFGLPGLLHHLLCEIHEPRIEVGIDLIARCARAETFSGLRGALVLCLQRMVRKGRLGLVVEAIEHAHRAGSDAVSRVLDEVVRDALLQIARFGGKQLGSTLDELVERPTESVTHILIELLDRLLASGHLAPAESAARAACRAAEALGDVGLLASARLGEGRLLVQQGRTGQAFEVLELARAAAVESERPLVAHRIQLLRARILRDRHELDEAAALYSSARDGLSAQGAVAETAEALRGLASVSGRGADHQAQLRLLEEARALSEQADDAFGLAKTYNNIGRTHIQLGAYQEAEVALMRALALHRSLGARRSMAIVELNLGALYYQQLQSAEDAEQHWQRALINFEKLGHARGVAAALTNLGGSMFVRGESRGAAELIERALSLWEEAQELAYVANALHLLCMCALDLEEESPHADRHAALATQLDTPIETLHAAVIHTRTCARSARDAAAIEAALSRLEKAREDLGVEPNPEDGVAFAHRDAARALAKLGARESAARAARAALESIGTAAVEWRDEMKQIGG